MIALLAAAGMEITLQDFIFALIGLTLFAIPTALYITTFKNKLNPKQKALTIIGLCSVGALLAFNDVMLPILVTTGALVAFHYLMTSTPHNPEQLKNTTAQ